MSRSLRTVSVESEELRTSTRSLTAPAAFNSSSYRNAHERCRRRRLQFLTVEISRQIHLARCSKLAAMTRTVASAPRQLAGDRQPSPIFANEPFIELRQMYFNGLRGDRIQLVRLATRLARDTLDAEDTLAELRRVAHKMRGAAAIFEAPMIVCAAASLEEAAGAASNRNARSPDLRVCEALDNLVDCVARLTGSNTG